MSPRVALISGAAIGGAVLWGAVEFIALQWSLLSELWHRFRVFRTV
jgi:hypothetical protein